MSFADALANNTKLRELKCDSFYHVTSDGYAAFTSLLCNTLSIQSTYRSNHTLERLSDHEWRLPEDLRSLLRINRENSNSDTARIKIIRTHFSGSNINTQIFTGMELNVIPTAIAWMGRDGGNGLLFAFLMRMPLLCTTKSKCKKKKIEC